MKRLLLSYLICVTLLSISVHAETIVVNDTVYSDTLNLTIVNTTRINELNMTVSDFEKLYELTERLSDLSQATLQEKEFLNSLTRRLSTSEDKFIDTLEETSASYGRLMDLYTELQSDYNKDMTEKDTDIQKMEDRILQLEQDAYKDSIMDIVNFFVIAISFIFVTVIIINLKKKKKLYFVLRWIRERIPIRF